MQNKLSLLVAALLVPLSSTASSLTSFINDNNIEAVRDYLSKNPETNLIQVNKESDKSYLGQAIKLKHKRIALILAQHNNFQRENEKLLAAMTERANLLKKVEELEGAISKANSIEPTKAAKLKEQKANLLEAIASLESKIELEPKATHLEANDSLDTVKKDSDDNENLNKTIKLLESGIIARVVDLESQLTTIKSMLDANDELARQVLENVSKNQKPILTYESTQK